MDTNKNEVKNPLSHSAKDLGGERGALWLRCRLLSDWMVDPESQVSAAQLICSWISQIDKEQAPSLVPLVFCWWWAKWLHDCPLVSSQADYSLVQTDFKELCESWSIELPTTEQLEVLRYLEKQMGSFVSSLDDQAMDLQHFHFSNLYAKALSYLLGESPHYV